jgi:antitoxin MazE
VRSLRDLVEQIGLGAGSEVSLRAEDGAIVVRPASLAPLNLDALLAGVKAENLHTSVDTGEAVGLEIV